MEIVHTHCAGLDVHKKTVVAALIVPGPKRSWDHETRTCGTLTADLLASSDWLTAHDVTHGAMESTGEDGKPVFNLLESDFHVVLGNAQHIKAVPGRKTDVSDAEWRADPRTHGVLRARFGPPLGQRERRDVTRHRSTFVRERASVVNRVQKVLASAHITPARVATDVLGGSGRAMLEALSVGQASPTEMAELAKGRPRAKREPLAKAFWASLTTWTTRSPALRRRSRPTVPRVQRRSACRRRSPGWPARRPKSWWRTWARPCVACRQPSIWPRGQASPRAATQARANAARARRARAIGRWASRCIRQPMPPRARSTPLGRGVARGRWPGGFDSAVA